ncbi:MAG TPA: HAMP domain-containing histidine kinase [Clostridiaceae bacterium]|nr:HAMP domain-containing histidine kinase [Clostridiaceae bacterium]
MSAKKRVIRIGIIWGVLISILYLSLGFVSNYSAQSRAANRAVLEINALRQLMGDERLEGFEEAHKSLDRVEQFVQTFRHSSGGLTDFLIELLPLVLILLVLAVFLFFIYRKFLKPFEELEGFAENLARGNWDLPLAYRKDDYFGKFTWAFDNMRNELKQSKERELETIESNKLVISTLSHDIKTPVATIRAYAEVLGKKLHAHDDHCRQYADIIVQKADEIAKRTDDLFVHAISMMNRLDVQLEPITLAKKLREILSLYEFSGLELSYEDEPWPEGQVAVDPFRFEQVVENIMRNAEKYAPGPLDINMYQTADSISIVFRDYGPGIADRDIPFIFDKFYRGVDVRAIEGAGLGLYIVHELMHKMKGRVDLVNLPDGLKITLIFPK